MSADDATHEPEGSIAVRKSFWEQNVGYWKRSVGVWCCLMLGVVTFAHSKVPSAKVPRAELPHAMAAVAGQVSGTPAHATASDINPSVTLSYSTLDVTALNASAYGDLEF